MSDKVKILVTGATGLLGRQLVDTLGAREDLAVTGLRFSRGESNTSSSSLVRLDLTDFPAVSAFVKQLRPNFVVHAAAQRFPDKVEADPEAANLINVAATSHLAELCCQVRARLIFVSTDYVFDGRNAPYKPEAEPRPLNKYGETKLAGERAVLAVDPLHLVLRIPVLYGRVETLAESAVTVLLDLVRGGRKADVSSFEVRCPAHTRDIASIVLDLVTREEELKGGIYQWSGLEKLSKWDMVGLIGRETGLDIGHLSELAGRGGGAAQGR